MDLGPQWPHVSDSEVADLPLLPKDTPLTNPRFLARSYHSDVYLIDVTYRDKTASAILKIFSKTLKHRYFKETDAYRYLHHYGAPDEGIVPKIYGVLPSISKKRLSEILGNAVPDDQAPITTPASGVLMQHIRGAVSPSAENMTTKIAEAALDALGVIHSCHVLHGDAEGRNLLLYPETGKVVWIDFSCARINRSIYLASEERSPVKQFLYETLVIPNCNKVHW